MPVKTMVVKSLWTWFHRCKQFHSGIGSKVPVPKDNDCLQSFLREMTLRGLILLLETLGTLCSCGKIRLDVYYMYVLFFLSPELASLSQTPLEQNALIVSSGKYAKCYLLPGGLSNKIHTTDALFPVIY